MTLQQIPAFRAVYYNLVRLDVNHFTMDKPAAHFRRSFNLLTRKRLVSRSGKLPLKRHKAAPRS
jgi:hypothetical protein